MATIDYKEKYEQALEKARQFIEKPYFEDSAGIVGYIFPELKESEDERIRKWLINLLGEMQYHHCDDEREMGNKALAWLEKQGEQKPNDNKGMNLVEEEMTPFQKKVFCIIDTTIEEEQGLKQVCDELLALASNEIKQKTAEWNTNDEQMLNSTIKDLIHPCYEEIPDRIEEEIKWIKSMRNRVVLQPEQEWSEEDKEIIDYLIDYLESELDSSYTDLDKETFTKEINWLKSLKERVQPQPEQEWSEEDDDDAWLNDIISKAECNLQLNKDEITWLKSSRLHSQWKPSEEQMKALSDISVTGCISYAGQGQELINLYNDLKKLKGE